MTHMNTIGKNKHGFTLIELLVVIAIIGILAGSLTVTFGGTREKAQDALIKQNLSSIRFSAEEVYYEAYPNTYLPVCFESMVDLILKDLDEQTTLTQDYQCLSSNERWLAIFPLHSGGYWCSDGLGRSIPVDGFIEYSGEEYMDCTLAVAEDTELEAPPTSTPPPGGYGVVLNTVDGSVDVSINSSSGNPFRGQAWHKFHEPGFTAFDPTDGNISQEVIVNGPNLLSYGGKKNGGNPCPHHVYELEYSVTNSAGQLYPSQTRLVNHHQCN